MNDNIYLFLEKKEWKWATQCKRHAEFLKNLIGFLFICFNYSFKGWERQQLLKYDSLGDSELANCSNIGFSWKWNN